MPNRTPEDLVRDLVKKNVPWPGILSIARSCRNGAWYDEVKSILLERKLMPADRLEQQTQADAMLAKAKSAFDEEEKKRRPKYVAKP